VAEQTYGIAESDVPRLSAVVRAYESGSLGNLDPRATPKYRQDYVRWRFRNDATTTAPASGVLRMTGMATVDGVQYMTVSKPDTSFNRLYLVNGLQDVAANDYGWATFLWHADYVLYDTGNTPAFGESWGPQNGTWTLKKYRYGFTIMGGNITTESGKERTVAVQSPVNLIYGQAQGTIADGATGTMEVFDGNNTILHASTTVSAVHRFSATTIADDSKLEAAWNGGTWNIIAARCP